MQNADFRKTENMKVNKYIYVSFLVLITQLTFGQKKDENIGSEVVNVVKPYTPTISDAFKVKETPSMEDDETAKKENIKYNIFSFPVASTFTPSKGRAADVDKTAKEKLFSNYATLAAGNYGTINAELFVTQTLESGDYVGAMLRHLSSQGGIKDVVLDDKFYNTSLDLTYGSRNENLSWNADAGYQNQVYNWYGIQQDLFTSAQIDAIDEQQTYHNAYFGGRIKMNESILKDASIKFNRFWDSSSSGENHFVAKPSLAFDVMQEKIKLGLIFDYLNGSFKNDYYGVQAEKKYGFTNVGFTPSFQLNRDDLSLNLGATFFYSIANELGKNKFFVYPSITASYKVVGDLMIAYAGAEGTLKQNTYKEFVDNNYFVSPTLDVAPTDQRYDIYVGLRGKLANSIGYNVRGSYQNEGNKALYKNNIYETQPANTDGYSYGNSFGVVYDDVKTVSFFGELKADFSKNVTFGINGTFSSFSTKNELEPWNLPSIKIGSTVDFNVTSKWYAGLNVFFVGERKDQFIQSDMFDPANIPTVIDITLDSYFDLNAHVGYKFSDRLTFFLKGNNLASQNYQRWINYPVQGIQVMAGANYKFDF